VIDQNLTYTRIAERNVSFQLLRTNPKLTTNIKLTVDSGGDLWLNSINANSQLSSQKYKRFAISETSSHEVNLYRFYDNGKTPTSISYQLGSTIGLNAIAKDLKDQYDFDLYTSGAKYLTDKQYSEKFTYFAPIYLDKILPEKFVIFKIPGASNYTAGAGRELYNNGTSSTQKFATDLFTNAEVIKVFDLSESSKLGKYIHNISKNPMFTQNPLYVNYKDGGYSIYRGASISSGTYVELPELISSVLSRSLPLLKVEQFVTLGFERNNIVHPKILNLEFLFDDITANPYEFNRYFGVYCNDIDLETFEFDLAKMYELSLSENTADNDQTFSTNFTQSDDISFTLTNSTGVKLRGYGLSKNLSDIYYNRTSTNTLFFPYLKTKNNQIHLIKPLSWNQTDTVVDFQLDDNQFDLGLAFGPTDLITQETADLSKLDTKATILIQVFNTPQHLDKLRIYHPSGSMFNIADSGGKYDELIFVSGYFIDNESYSLSYLSSGESVVYVNADKDLEQIAQAIVDIVSDFKDSSITGIRMYNHAFIQTQSYGNTFGSLKVRSLEATSILPKFKINDKVTGDLVFADGGFLNRPHPIIALGNATKLANQLDNIVVKTNQNWSKISRICNLADPIKTGLSLTDQLTAITDFKTKASIQLVDNETIRFDHGKIEIRKNFKPSIGVLSIFETMDFNFSTYTSDYSRNLLLDIYKDFFIPENTLMLDFTKYTYQLVGDGTVNINGIDYSDSATLIWQNTSTISKYNVRSNGPSGKPILIYGLKLPASSSTSRNRLDIPYFDESQDALNYIGPFSIKADHIAIDPTLPTYSYRDKFLQSNLSSEYHAYLENYTTDFAIDGRVIPYITKWGITDSTDVRDNPYRLNSDILFGKDNFGPSHRETSATPEKLTHEWFYIESDFGYTKDISLARNNFYYFDQPLIIDELINSDTYFNNYFTYLPTIDGQYNSINNLEYSSTDNIQVGRPQYRYSLLSKNEFSKQYETVFKGSLFRFYELTTSQTPVSNSTRFEDYKFTVLLKPIKEDPNLVKQPVKYRVIENTNSKSITVLIELALGYKSQLNNSIFLEDWINVNQSVISQSTLFSNSLKSAPTTYNIDVDSTAISLATYQNQISGISLVPGLALGQTIHITYIEPITNRTLSTIIATPGSDVYNAIQLEKIASGDKLGPRVYAKVQKNVSIILSTGSYICSTITAYFEDIWENGNPDLPISSGQIYEQTNYAPVVPGPPAAAEFNSSTTNLIISNTSMTDPSNRYFRDSIGSNQSSKLDKLFSTAALPRFSLATNTGGYFEIFFDIISQNTPADADTYDINIAHSSGILSSSPGSPAYMEPLIFKADWFIPEYTDSNSLAATNFTVENSIAYYDSMFGDYRIEFNENSVSNLTHSFLYYAKSKKYNNKIDAYSTIKLSRGVNLSSSGIYVNLSLIPEYAETLPLIGLETYDTSADSEINQISTSFAPLYIIKPGEKSILVQRAIGAPLTATALSSSSYNDGISGAFQNVINFIGSGPALSLVNPLPNSLGDIPNFTYTEQSLPSGITLDWIDNANQFQIFGGINYFQKVFENLSFAKFFQLLDKNQDAISWESYTNGILTNYKTLSIEILDADTISKSTVISITPDQVTEGRINTNAGYSLTERPSKPYEVNRYSAEYEIITKPVAGFKYNFSINSNSLPGANICFNPEVDNFFIIPDFEYVKYSTQNILSLENSQNYSAVYPLINETPISRTNFNSLASSWDYNYHFESLNKSESTGVAGSKRVVEDYSFISKLINLPNEFLIEEFTSIELTQRLFNISQAAEADIVYANYPEQVKFKINIASLITKHLSNNGLRSEFQKFFKYDDGSQISLDSDFLGELTFEEFLSQYCLLNLIKLYRVDNFEFYELDDRTIQGNLVEFNQVSYNSLNNLGYDLIKNIRINNTKSRVVEGSILLKPNTGVKLVPKIKIKFI
jgi:hypothetical protein